MDFWQCLASLKCTVIFEMLPQTFNVGIARELKAFVVFSTTSEKEIQPDFPRDKNYQRLVHALGWIMTREESGVSLGNGAKKRPAERPNGHLLENQSYPELPQDMGDL